MNDPIGDLSGAYALDALTPEERAQFEARLASSEALRTEAGELNDTAALLGLAVASEAPPASLKSDLMARIAQTPQLAPLSTETPAERKAATRWFTRPVTVLTSVAAAAALILGGVAIADVVGGAVFQQQQADQLAAINAADDSQRVSADVAGGGTATLVWSTQLATSALIVDGLDTLPADRVYELWYIDDAGARPAGTFTVGESGSTWRVLDGAMGADDVVGVTVEPAGGSKTPTTDPIVVLASA